MGNSDKTNYKLPFYKELFISIASLFVLFVLVIFFFQFNLERESKKEMLNSILQDYNNLIYREYSSSKMTEARLDSIIKGITDKNLRVTIMTTNGKVLTDSGHNDSIPLPSHSTRPEVMEALQNGLGYAQRESATLGKDFFYSTRRYGDIIVRSSLPFDVSTMSMLKADNKFTYFLFAISILVILLLYYFCNKLSRSISILQEFSQKAEQDQPVDLHVKVAKNDIGDITHNIIRIYKNLRATKNELSIEKEKLITHLQFSKEGLAVFSTDKKAIIANNLFIQYVNLISDDQLTSTDDVFSLSEFKKITVFIDNNLWRANKTEEYISDSMTVTKNGKSFLIECIIFQDRTFEISLNNITQQEEESRLKKQLTQNIAHELKTPVSSIQGYMETIISNPSLSNEKRVIFLERCYAQTIRLTGLLQDISILNRIDESNDLFDMESIDLGLIINEVINDTIVQLEEKHMRVEISVPENAIINGNHSLLYSIFRNLTDNTIAYAGENTQVSINCYLQDANYYYFSFSDNGPGVSEEHLNRLFERFYRVDKGRSRKLGGTGLGLAIVKNAVIFHKGEILAKNKLDGGLEFLFTLKK
ncbi:sensor histidine kinase [Coprobacter tertius]|uniref:histidine kinase n=1 Tax=Coprobacter tertius TaxID=2944915 RepID=A0ABT1MI91_9BACT|nr:ATP-binding protein [Coprobacter tertius]MCP9612089.1 ATP-binding protein [Coprobacter tertius]